MPELPEVETTMQGLAKIMAGQKIAQARCRRKDLRFPLPKGLAERLKGKSVVRLERRAKYMLIHLSDGLVWMVHLGMSGRFCKIDAAQYDRPQKHDHVLIALDNRHFLAFNDPRRFGMMDLVKAKDIADHKLLKHLGFEPLDKSFTGKTLYEKLRAKKQTAIKLAIMDQRLVVGVGNIYASEALYYAGIDPRRKSASLSPKECNALARAVKKVLNKAIIAGGSSLRDYVQSDGTLGNFQEHFSVYGKAGKACKTKSCGGSIQKMVQAGRVSYYCKECQA